MEVLKVAHEDFDLSVRCTNFGSTFSKARAKQASIHTSTSYSATFGRLLIINPDSNQLMPPLGNSHPVFFENKDYTIRVVFQQKDKIRGAYFFSKTRDIQDKFSYENEFGLLMGTVNFGNDLGKSELILRYRQGDQLKEFRLNFEVFPTKLDFRNDYSKVVQDIEREYPRLVLDFLKKTYSGFTAGNSPNTDLIWWQIFGGLYAEFIHSSKFILNKPHSRIIRKTRYVKADRIVTWTSSLEEKFGEFKRFPETQYFTEYKTLTTDTPENRFFKHAVRRTTRRYKKIHEFITGKYSKDISDGFRTEMSQIGKQMDTLSNNPFFNSISSFRGIKQESLVLQKGSGYSSVYKCWVILNSGLKFLEGIRRIELKNIADLYQIWCFLEIKNILQTLLGKETPDSVDLAEIQIDDFVFKIVTGRKSKISFRTQKGDLIDLFHDLSFGKNPADQIKSYTVNQRPDIVLRISKSDLREKYVLTYLYDAKYRLQSDDSPTAPDWPPEDAINQMHRYRDAIYFVNPHNSRPEKEVIGAYVLFPGSGGIEDVQSSTYYRSIQDVNIGAFPLRPNDLSNRVLLEDHLKAILGIDTETALNEVAPQKMSSYEAPNPEVLIGIVPDADHADCFDTNDTPFYFTGRNKPNHFGYKNLRFFAPYIMGKGIREYFEILSYRIVVRSDLFENGHRLYRQADNSERLLFLLGAQFQVSPDYKFFKLSDGIIRHFRYTKLVHLRNPTDNKIETLKVT